jgi:hypothetical protein
MLNLVNGMRLDYNVARLQAPQYCEGFACFQSPGI